MSVSFVTRSKCLVHYLVSRVSLLTTKCSGGVLSPHTMSCVTVTQTFAGSPQFPCTCYPIRIITMLNTEKGLAFSLPSFPTCCGPEGMLIVLLGKTNYILVGFLNKPNSDLPGSFEVRKMVQMGRLKPCSMCAMIIIWIKPWLHGSWGEPSSHRWQLHRLHGEDPGPKQVFHNVFWKVLNILRELEIGGENHVKLKTGRCNVLPQKSVVNTSFFLSCMSLHWIPELADIHLP